MRDHAKWCAVRSNRCRDIVIFKLLGCRLPQSWISLDLKFVTEQTVTRAEAASPCKILLKLWPRYGDFSFFSKWRQLHVGFLKLQISHSGTHHQCRIATPCQISWRQVKPLSRYLDFGFFKMLAATSLDFLKFCTLTNRTVRESRTAPACQISSKSVKPRPKYGYFQIFQDVGRPRSAVFDL